MLILCCLGLSILMTLPKKRAAPWTTLPEWPGSLQPLLTKTSWLTVYRFCVMSSVALLSRLSLGWTRMSPLLRSVSSFIDNLFWDLFTCTFFTQLINGWICDMGEIYDVLRIIFITRIRNFSTGTQQWVFVICCSLSYLIQCLVCG